MKAQILLLCCLLGLSAQSHAEGGCPAGMVPEGGQGAMSCRPLPGYSQGGAQAAPSIRWFSRWGAIAMDTQVTRLSGASHDKASRKDAEQLAMKNCLDQGAKECEIISAYSNGCVALAMGESLYGVASRSAVPEAKDAAMAQCTDATCRIIYTQCSQPLAVRYP